MNKQGINKQGIGLWIVVVALLVLDISVHCVRAQDTTPAIVKAQELEIVDSSGREIIDMRTSKDGSAVLALYDSKGNPRAGMVASDTGGDMTMLDAAGKTVTSVSGDTIPGISVYKGDNEEIGLLLSQDGWPNLTFSDAAGNSRAFFGYDPGKDRSILQLTDKDSKQTAEMALTPDYSIIDVTDKASTRRAALRCMSDGTPTVYVADKDGNPTWTQTGTN